MVRPAGRRGRLAGEYSRRKEGADMALTTEQIARYRRSLLLPEIGERGQRRLARSRVLLVGAGGLGSAAALYLVA
ncbi:MAG TPA: molybdopterin biosynthesis protein MoeB, partial [Firmicutes bacterium]|nr:molybdopterin biosynthesis protein MoeB [Bacillota bacterium]